MKTAEKDLKNIRKVLNYNIEDFADCIGISKEDLILIEKEERKLANKELYTISSVLLNTIDNLLSTKNDLSYITDIEHKKRIESKKIFIMKLITDYIGNYNPANQDNFNFNKGTTTVIKDNELINPKDSRKKMKKVLRELNK